MLFEISRKLIFQNAADWSFQDVFPFKYTWQLKNPAFKIQVDTPKIFRIIGKLFPLFGFVLDLFSYLFL